MKIALSLAGVGIILLVALIAAVVAVPAALWGSRPGTPSVPAGPVGDIPPAFLAVYVEAAQGSCGLPWTLLAAIGKIESDHGRSTLPGVHSGTNSAGAAGPMQFLSSTFAAVVHRHPIPVGGAQPPSPYDYVDAIWAAAFYVCDSGGSIGDYPAAVFTYNHSTQYVGSVMAQARAYAAESAAAQPPGAPPATTNNTTGSATADQAPAASPVAARALAWANGQLGRPYQWGGDGPAHGDAGFDCSGLTAAAYATAGIQLPRTADAQFHVGPAVPPGEPLQPGDLVFYRAAVNGPITHVALYSGAGRVVEALETGRPVLVAPLATAGYAGATRPAAAEQPQRPAIAAGPAAWTPTALGRAGRPVGGRATRPSVRVGPTGRVDQVDRPRPERGPVTAKTATVRVRSGDGCRFCPQCARDDRELRSTVMTDNTRAALFSYRPGDPHGRMIMTTHGTPGHRTTAGTGSPPTDASASGGAPTPGSGFAVNSDELTAGASSTVSGLAQTRVQVGRSFDETAGLEFVTPGTDETLSDTLGRLKARVDRLAADTTAAATNLNASAGAYEEADAQLSAAIARVPGTDTLVPTDGAGILTLPTTGPNALAQVVGDTVTDTRGPATGKPASLADILNPRDAGPHPTTPPTLAGPSTGPGAMVDGRPGGMLGDIPHRSTAHQNGSSSAPSLEGR